MADEFQVPAAETVKVEPTPQAGFFTKFGFWLRAAGYLVIAITGAIAGASIKTAMKYTMLLCSNPHPHLVQLMG